MDAPHLVLEYLRVLLSGPVVAGTVTLLLVRAFRTQVRELLTRIAHIKFPGGDATFGSQRDRATEESLAGAPAPTQLAPGFPANIQLTPEQADRVASFIKDERANAALWEYRYLNHFLVRSTQATLDWLASINGTTSIRLVDTYLQQWIPSASERKAILDALEKHHLITITGETIEVTPKGREYIAWRGPLPALRGSV